MCVSRKNSKPSLIFAGTPGAWQQKVSHYYSLFFRDKHSSLSLRSTNRTLMYKTGPRGHSDFPNDPKWLPDMKMLLSNDPIDDNNTWDQQTQIFRWPFNIKTALATFFLTFSLFSLFRFHRWWLVSNPWPQDDGANDLPLCYCHWPGYDDNLRLSILNCMFCTGAKHVCVCVRVCVV